MCDISESKALLSPTDHFKQFCGNEWLNPNGKLTYANALEFVELQIQQRGLKEKDGMIFLNEYFQNLFQDYRTFMYRHEIPELARRFFA